MAYKPWHKWMLCCEMNAVVVVELGLQCSDLSHGCSVESFHTALCL